MLSQIDKDFIANSYIDLYSTLGYRMAYVPLDPASTTDKTGKFNFLFLEASAVAFHGSYAENETFNPDIALVGTTRADAQIRLVLKELKDAGINAPRIKDAIDVFDDSGNLIVRYVITGFGVPPALSSFFAVALVTDINAAFKS